MTLGPRMRSMDDLTSPCDGCVVWSPVKSIWYITFLLIAITIGPYTWCWGASIASCVLTIVTLGAGHSVGFHRLLIHRSFECSKWLEYLLVTIGTLVGMGGPRRMLYLHDIRDWSQRHSHCHDFFIHKSGLLKDWWWNLNCEIQLKHPPRFCPEEKVTMSRYYAFLDRYWMAVQIPVAILLYCLGGVPWVIWGICVRIPLSLTGHWFVGYLAHNCGTRDWHLNGHAVQGYNLPGLGLLTMGEAWHNNHHAFPESARLGLQFWQLDPGWWLITTFKSVGLIWNVKTPIALPCRPELEIVAQTATLR